MKVLLAGITENDYIRGVERYVFETAKALALQFPDVQIEVLAGAWQKYYEPLSDLGIHIRFVDGLENSKAKRHLFHFSGIHAYSRGADILHVCNTLPVRRTARHPTFVTIHDLAEYFVPEKYSRSQVIYRKMIAWLAANQADRVVTVSHFSADVIADTLGVAREKILVTYNGIEHIRSELELAPPPKKLDAPFIFYWGVIEHSKGLLELIEACQALRVQDLPVKLVLAGKRGNAWGAVAPIVDASTWIEYLDFVNDRELISWIRGASVVAFPSRYEGFGLPAVEAFLWNDNVVASSTTALGEITRDFAQQVDPADVHGLAQAIRLLIEKPKSYTSDFRSAVWSKFSWRSSARSLLEQYQQALVKPAR